MEIYPKDGEAFSYTAQAIKVEGTLEVSEREDEPFTDTYGYKEGYFDSIIAKVEAVAPTAFADLIANIRKAKALAQEALTEPENENYTSQYQYVEMFGQEDYIFTLNKGDELAAQMNEIYTEFANWLGSWEM